MQVPWHQPQPRRSPTQHCPPNGSPPALRQPVAVHRDAARRHVREAGEAHREARQAGLEGVCVKLCAPRETQGGRFSMTCSGPRSEGAGEAQQAPPQQQASAPAKASSSVAISEPQPGSVLGGGLLVLGGGDGSAGWRVGVGARVSHDACTVRNRKQGMDRPASTHHAVPRTQVVLAPVAPVAVAAVAAVVAGPA